MVNGSSWMEESFGTMVNEENDLEGLASDDDVEVDESTVFFPPYPHSSLPVYSTIHTIRNDIVTAIDDSYSLEQLKSPRFNLAIVRPLVDRLYALHDISVVYCLLVNRVQFLREQSHRTNNTSVDMTRALFCELLAIKILRRFDEDNDGPKALLLLSNILVAGFDPFQNAPDEVVNESRNVLDWTVQKRGGYERKLTALEIAIISESKMFLSFPSCQKVIEAIYIGKVIYTPNSFMDLIPDHYKHTPISLYDPRDAPMLNQYRLNVPRTRSILEVCHFVILLGLFILVMEKRDDLLLTNYEIVFCVYALGWVLDQFATIMEHGWQVYTQNLWSFLDVVFVLIYWIYLGFRLRGLVFSDDNASQQALDVLSMAAPVLIPRLAFNVMSENMLFVSLRAMMADFILLTALAVWCFGGFLLSLMWLNVGNEDNNHSPITISKWMLWVWFGLDGSGIQRSVDFHWLLGPILWVTFAFLGNTLFLTILVSMLSNTFAVIVANVTAEIQFRRAVLTFEGVKSDAIFAYHPPFNILAVCIVLPLKFVLSPRWFHKINVTAVRTINLPILLAISLYERNMLWTVPHTRKKVEERKPSRLQTHWGLTKFSVHRDIQAVFDIEPPSGRDENDAEGEDLDERSPGFSKLLNNKRFRNRLDSDEMAKMQLRKSSIISLTDINEHMPEFMQDTSMAKHRLEALEASTRRIEALLKKMMEKDDEQRI